MLKNLVHLKEKLVDEIGDKYVKLNIEFCNLLVM